MGFAWFLIGAVTAVATVTITYLHNKHSLTWLQSAPLILGAVLLIFSCAWGAGSFFEGVPRAASMGFVMFGLPGVVLLVHANRCIQQAKTAKGSE